MSVHPIQQKSAVHILFFSYASIPGRVKNPENSDYVAIDTMDDNVEHIWHGQKPRVVRRGTTGMRKANQSIDRWPSEYVAPSDRLLPGYPGQRNREWLEDVSATGGNRST
jgi:hypothetical protein